MFNELKSPLARKHSKTKKFSKKKLKWHNSFATQKFSQLAKLLSQIFWLIGRRKRDVCVKLSMCETALSGSFVIHRFIKQYNVTYLFWLFLSFPSPHSSLWCSSVAFWMKNNRTFWGYKSHSVFRHEISATKQKGHWVLWRKKTKKEIRCPTSSIAETSQLPLGCILERDICY